MKIGVKIGQSDLGDGGGGGILNGFIVRGVLQTKVESRVVM